MERVRNGDVDAFERVVDDHWKGTLLYAIQLARDHDTADDLAQEAFARLWLHRAEWRAGSVRIWLLRTTRHLFISRQRKRQSHSRWAASSDARAGRSPRTPLQDTESVELRQSIHQALRRLSPRRREAFTLVHLHGLSNKEVAEIMEVRPQTVANYLQAAIADLRVMLKPYFPSF